MANSDNKHRQTKHTQRYWRRAGKAQSGWLSGLLYLLMLTVLFAYGWRIIAPEIEAQTRVAVLQTLQEAGFEDASVSVDGQDVYISGYGVPANEARLELLASAASCVSFGYSLKCPEQVKIALTEPAVTHKSEVKVKPVPIITQNFMFHKKPDAVLLQGQVPSAAMQALIVEKASQQSVQIENRLQVTEQATQPGLEWAVAHAFAVMQHLYDGRISWRDGSLSVAGGIFKQHARKVRDVFYRTDATQFLGSLRVEVLDVARRCNHEFASLLSASNIQFESGRAQLAAESESLIARLAALTRTCPMDLAVEGHTDSTGTENINIDLSYARAEAVIAAFEARGVDVARMTAYGYGSMKPLAGNHTAAGRAQNRRIEIRAIAK